MSDEALRPIWLCADDYGISPAVNGAIRDLILRRRLNATSVMVVAPSFHRMEAVPLGLMRTAAGRFAIGLHVTLTGPFKPRSRGFKPVRGGAFLPLERMFRRAMLRTLSRKRIKIEIASQFEAFVTAFGRVPDFVDGHQHVHLFPQVRDAFIEVVREVAPDAWVRQCGRVAMPLGKRLADKKGLVLDMLSAEFRKRAAAAGLATNVAFAGTYDFTDPNAPEFSELFPRFLEGLPEGGLVMCHPGRVDAELEALDNLTHLREREYAFMTSERFAEVLREQGVSLG